MKNSYIIKHEDPSFEKAHARLKKREQSLNPKGGQSRSRPGSKISSKNMMNHGKNIISIDRLEGKHSSTVVQAKTLGNASKSSHYKGDDSNQTKTPGHRPPARDGHTGLVIGSVLFVFGGDRHHMPFNDLHILDLLSEFEEKSLIEI